MPILSYIAQKKKINYFISGIDKNAQILEIGSGTGWLSNYMKTNGWMNYSGVDIIPPADITGDIRDWKKLGLVAESYDYIIAFEVVEHLDIFPLCYELLKTDGLLLVTTPIPAMDWFLKLLECVGLNQKRSSPHDNLTKLKHNQLFKLIEYKRVAGLSQWGKLIKI